MKKVLYGFAGIVLVILVLVGVYKYLLTTSEITARVADINKGEFVSLCIVGEDTKSGCDEYTNNDTWWFFKFDSGKVRSRLAIAEQDKKTVTVKVQGLRITFLSWRKNIIKIVE